MNNFTHIRDWFKSIPGRITLLLLGFIAVLAIVIFNQQITNLLNLIGSKADTGHTIVVNGVPTGTEHGFFEGNYDGQPDKTNCFKIEGGKLMLNSTCPQAQIASISPTNGPAGQTVTITGSGFVSTAVVKFDNVQANILSLTDTMITVAAPAHTPGQVQVSITVPGGPTDSFDGYTYNSAPTVVSINPTAGNAGEVVNITGAGFVTGATVMFGTNPATNVSFIDGANMTATAPAGTGRVHVIVTNPDGQSSAPVDTDQFLYPD